MLAIEHRKVLILNKSWVPIQVEPLFDAVNKLFPEGNKPARAKILNPEDWIPYSWKEWGDLLLKEDEPYIKGYNRNWKIPEIIITHYNKVHNANRVKFSRKQIYHRDHNTCMYCGKKFTTEELSIDHVTPRAQGGLTTWENCVLSCIACNSKKANRTPEQAKMKLLTIPKKPRMNFLRTDRKNMPKSWSTFLADMYWNIELENDNLT